MLIQLCKLFENTYRDVNIALANQMAEIAEGLGVDARYTAFDCLWLLSFRTPPED